MTARLTDLRKTLLASASRTAAIDSEIETNIQSRGLVLFVDLTTNAGGAGNATVIVTAAGMTNSPKTVSVAVASGDSASAVGGKVRTALTADSDVNGFFVVSGAGANIILTARAKAANDATLNISIANGTSLGLTAAPTSADTTPGVAPVLQVETATIHETVPGTLTAGNMTATVTASGMSNSPKAVTVAVALNDTESQVAGKVRTALTADVDVSAFFTVSGTGVFVILTAKVAAANDATMNIATADGTSAGIASTATSANTTAGVAGTAQVETGTVVGTVDATGNGTITPSILIRDPVSGNYVTIWTATSAISAVGTKAYSFYPGASYATSSYTEAIQTVIPVGEIKVHIAVANADPITYSASCAFVP